MYNRIAVISDIHSNSFALEAVLKDAYYRNADLIVNLGDDLFGPVDPLGTARILMQQPEIINILGNCDELLLQESSESLSYLYVKPLLGIVETGWIRSHLKLWSYDNLLFCHGTPWDNSRYMLEQISPEGAVSLKNAEQLAWELHTIQEQIVFCGHSHVPGTAVLPDGRSVVNPGSVGLPAYAEEMPYPHIMESGTPCASYCICRRAGELNEWKVEHILVEYGWNQAADLAASHGRQDYADAIRTGRVAPAY
ncbi:metallophosphoesterase family protein [Paenibacillus sp. sgz500958]|uniref:metallophosphoesterase family protein n=1 Tax=Paenibacillus sp. sgz500958 TaxID=3242475 RepID=UPI0036D3E12B